MLRHDVMLLGLEEVVARERAEYLYKCRAAMWVQGSRQQRAGVDIYGPATAAQAEEVCVFVFPDLVFPSQRPFLEAGLRMHLL